MRQNEKNEAGNMSRGYSYEASAGFVITDSFSYSSGLFTLTR